MNTCNIKIYYLLYDSKLYYSHKIMICTNPMNGVQLALELKTGFENENFEKLYKFESKKKEHGFQCHMVNGIFSIVGDNFPRPSNLSSL